MAKKEVTWRGLNVVDLANLALPEFMKLVNARHRRSLSRGFTDEQKKLLAKIEKKEKDIKTHCRDMVIIPSMLGSKIGVHNGKEFVQITIQHDMLGFYLGEFALTRKYVQHSAPGVGATRSSASVSVK